MGVFGASIRGTGVFGAGGLNGVQGVTANSSASGVWGENSGPGNGVVGKSTGGVGVYGIGSPAGKFDGDVYVNGAVHVSGDVYLANQDIAERFGVASPTNCDPGTVMVIGQCGLLEPCSQPYDKRVVGVVSGAASLRPAVTLGHGRLTGPDAPIALVGTAYCLVDADIAEVEIGDLLTSSSFPGHAMRADPSKSAGAVIGKALAPLLRGRALIPIVISLQ
jgi:hypothetical protein